MLVEFKRVHCVNCFKTRWHEGAVFAEQLFLKCVVCGYAHE